jgi:CRISPR system Cascade subunit CasB
VENRHLPGDRGALARLRRCATVMDAAAESATLELCRALGRGEAGLERAALLAAVLAHVREDVPGMKVARQIGVHSDKTAVMSDLRFRRLLQAATPDEQITAFRRLVALAGGKLNIFDLATGLLGWDDEKTRLRWIYAYYDTPGFQPNTGNTQNAIEDATP